MLIAGIISSIIIFSIIVLIHELGHFAAARIFGVKVEEFGLGIPPRAKKLFFDKKGTLFSLNWLPLGGFVKLTGEQPHTFTIYNTNKELYTNSDLKTDLQLGIAVYHKQGSPLSADLRRIVLEKLDENNASYNLGNKPARQQIIIILAGVCMNFLLAIVIFSILFFVGIKPLGINTHVSTERVLRIIPTIEVAKDLGIIEQNPGVRIQPVAGSIAEKSGLLEGDIVISINNTALKDSQHMLEIVGKSAGDLLLFSIQRSEQISPIELIIQPGPDAKIGAYLGDNIIVNTDFTYKYGLSDSIKYGTLETYNQSILTFQAIGSLVRKIIRPENPTERKEAIEQVSGPIGIVDFISGALSNGIIFLIIIGAIISINLGVFNLLPIPALDGGRFLFIVINGIILKIFGKKAIGEKIESVIHIIFFIILILLSIVIAYHDILKITLNP